MNSKKPSEHIIWLQHQAPKKPEVGQACNGCGVCCAAEPCPVSRVFLFQWRGACRALEWDAQALHYRCGMLLRPTYHARYLPTFLHSFMARCVKRWIAAGTACDSDAQAS